MSQLRRRPVCAGSHLARFRRGEGCAISPQVVKQHCVLSTRGSRLSFSDNHEQRNEELLFHFSSIDGAHNDHQDDIRSPVADSDKQSQVVFKVLRIDFRYAEEYVIIRRGYHGFACFQETHEVSQVVALTGDEFDTH